MARSELPWVLQALPPTNEPPRFYPGLVAGFEAVGFRQVGGLHAKFHLEADREALVASYAPEVQPGLRVSSETPERVLVAPDATAFVGVDWFWHQPSVRLRTLLADDTAVETQRAWDHLPPWPVSGQEYVRHLRLRPEQDHSARGRRFAVVEGDDMARLWEVHRSAVRSSRSRSREHRTIDHAAVLWALLLHHDLRAEARAALWGQLLGLRWRLRYARWLRPEFRGHF
jgi:hypothetical protein